MFTRVPYRAIAMVLLCCPMTVAACGSNTAPSHTDPAPQAPTQPGTTPQAKTPSPTQPTAPPKATTPAANVNDSVAYQGSFRASTGQYSITVAGHSRQVYLYVPAGLPASPSLVVAYHGTGGTPKDFLDELDGKPNADTNKFIIALPAARDSDKLPQGGKNADHDDGGPGWDLSTQDLTQNEDLLLTRAIIAEAKKSLKVDPQKVYSVGHSNGGFMSFYSAMKLNNQFAAFASMASGLITCTNRAECTEGVEKASNCNAITAAKNVAAKCGGCTLAKNSFPVAKPSGRIPMGYFQHNSDDDIVSPLYSCRAGELLGQRATVKIVPHSRSDDPRAGHAVSDNFMANAWAFLSSKTLAN